MGPTAAVTARVRDTLILSAAWVAGCAFAAIFAINIVQIVARQFTGGWTWVPDLSALLFAWMVMLGAAAAYGRHDHIAASFLVERAPDGLRRLVAYLVRGIEVLIGLIIFLAGLTVVETRMQISYIQLGVPTGWTFLAIPVLGALIVLFGLTSRPYIPTTLEQVESEAIGGGASHD